MRHTVRETITTLLELAGAAAIAGGVAMIYVPAGIIVAGAGLFGISYLVERGRKGTGPR